MMRSRKEQENAWVNSLHMIDSPDRQTKRSQSPSNRTTSKMSKLEQMSAQELLDASLTSLEAIKRQSVMTNSVRSLEVSGKKDVSFDDELSSLGEPSPAYLRGALWLGKNLLMIVEDTAVQMDLYRSRYLREVSVITQDSDSVRSAHRLSLMATSGITETMGAINKTRNTCRELIQVWFLRYVENFLCNDGKCLYRMFQL